MNFLKGGKKPFFKMLDDNLINKRDFIYVCMSNEKSEMYLNKDFEIIDQDKYN